MLRIATANINGIRASRRRGFDDWLAGRGCDVVALQEVRAQADKVPDGSFGDYHVALDTGTLPGRNGVAVLTRHPPAAVRTWSGTAFMGVPAEVVARADVSAFTETGAFAEVGAFAEAVGPTGHVPDPPGRDAVTGGPLVTSTGDIARPPHQRPVRDTWPGIPPP
ncbi:endonuclease/exonuclease/phosphatase family protein, partial [Brachybacterium alimentarium]|uniref:endonuclease/exonuclease/phosphatase family protein n=1 Tax=Brachybacterium alimentarium TaxID=47845 RepID=UPI0031D6F14B